MRKSGKKHKTIRAMPLGIKRINYEINNRIAINAIRFNVGNDSTVTDLFVFVMICGKLPKKINERYLNAHVHTAHELLLNFKANGFRLSERDIDTLQTSLDILIIWYNRQDNTKIIKILTDAMSNLNTISTNAPITVIR